MNSDLSIIAEIGSVHDGSFGNAIKAIEAAASSGATSVKFQTHLADEESLPDAPSPSYFSEESRIDYFKRTAFTPNQWSKLAACCIDNNVSFLSSPFSLEAVDLLESVGITSYKIPSGEVSNIPLLEHVSKTSKPVILSSGMSDWSELDSAYAVLSSSDLTILQCSSLYPCPSTKVGLNILSELKQRYNCNVGFSDHTLGFAAPISAVALGATVIEKHFTFSKLMYGSDAQHSLEPNDFKRLVSDLHEARNIFISPIDKNDISDYVDMKYIFEKSLVSLRSISVGDTVKFSDLAFKKPSSGIKASQYKSFLGKKVTKYIPINSPIHPHHFQ